MYVAIFGGMAKTAFRAGRSFSPLAADASWFVISRWDPQGWMVISVISYAH